MLEEEVEVMEEGTGVEEVEVEAIAVAREVVVMEGLVESSL